MSYLSKFQNRENSACITIWISSLITPADTEHIQHLCTGLFPREIVIYGFDIFYNVIYSYIYSTYLPYSHYVYYSPIYKLVV